MRNQIRSIQALHPHFPRPLLHLSQPLRLPLKPNSFIPMAKTGQTSSLSYPSKMFSLQLLVLCVTLIYQSFVMISFSIRLWGTK